MKKILASVLALALALSCAPVALAAEPDVSLTRGEAAEMLLDAADGYNPGVRKSDILKGYPDGSLREEEGVTRLQALLMLERAFGGLPEATGAYALQAYDASNFADIPLWAEEELANVLQSGIVVGTSATTLEPGAPVTRAQMEIFIRRVYALEGSNLKDDFYATVNREYLLTAATQPGVPGDDTLSSLQAKTNGDIAGIIGEIARTGGSTDKEKKIAIMYNNIMDWDSRNAAGLTPIQPYLDAIDASSNIKELMQVHNRLTEEQGKQFLLVFGPSPDPRDSDKNMLRFVIADPYLGQSGYANAPDTQKEAYLKFAAALLEAAGAGTEEARRQAQLCWDTESAIAEAMPTIRELLDVSNRQRFYTMEELEAALPAADLPGLLAAEGMKPGDEIYVPEFRAAEYIGKTFTDENLDAVKALFRFMLLRECSKYLSRDLYELYKTFNEELAGVSWDFDYSLRAARYVQEYLPGFVGEAYVKRCCPPETKAAVEEMLRDILDVYRGRVEKLDWMSDTTKEAVFRKLDAMQFYIGYPDEWNDIQDNAAILPASEGGSFYQNWVERNKAELSGFAAQLDQPADRKAWSHTVFTVNAGYILERNSVEVCAAILQPPFYDPDASYEENLGGIGFALAHEITHAFDNGGAEYDESGNIKNWWTGEDKAAFQELCQEVAEYFDGRECAPGIACDGAFTLSENIADIGAIACVTELAARQANPDYETLYRSASRLWREFGTRLSLINDNQTDIHARGAVRGNLPLQTCDQFYETFGITEGDGMWIPPEERVSIW